MSDTAAAQLPTAVLGLGLDVGGTWQSQKDRTLVQGYLLNGTGAGGAGGHRSSRGSLKLPSLVASARGRGSRGSVVCHSLSEPSLLSLSDHVHFDGISGLRHLRLLPKRNLLPFSKPPVLPSKSWHLANGGQQQLRPSYVHFSQPIHSGLRSRAARRYSHNPTLGDLRPPAVESLSVVGKTCLPSSNQQVPHAADGAAAAAAAAAPGRTQLHVFLPSEAEGEEVDSESVDEGFMDELDSKISSLKLQQRAPKMLYHC